MGIARGRFVIDTHVHAQRHAAKFKDGKLKADYSKLAANMVLTGMEVYDNSPRLLYDMDRYGVDMCVLVPAFAMTDEINEAIVKAHPDKFIAQCSATKYRAQLIKEKREWNIVEYKRLL